MTAISLSSTRYSVSYCSQSSRSVMGEVWFGGRSSAEPSVMRDEGSLQWEGLVKEVAVSRREGKSEGVTDGERLVAKQQKKGMSQV